MKAIATLAGLLALAGCAQSPCTQPDVLAFVDQARRSHDLYALGLPGDYAAGLADGAVRETPIVHVVPQSGQAVLNRHAAVCSAWMLSRNPAFQPGNGQPRFVRQRQDFTVVKLASGFEVAPYPP